MQAPRLARQWERAVVLRLGRFVGLRGPGLFWIVPFIDTVSSWIDQRTITTSFAAEQTLTSDTVPVNVDAVSSGWCTTREGRARGAGLCAGRQLGGADRAARHHRPHDADRPAPRARADRDRAAAADRSALEPVGRHRVIGGNARRLIPGALQDAMSREAQAAREKQARIILGEAEMEIAHSSRRPRSRISDNPTALHLRAMNMLYEGLKEKGAMMLVPSSAVESMGMGGLMGAAALRRGRLASGVTSGPGKAEA